MEAGLLFRFTGKICSLKIVEDLQGDSSYLEPILYIPVPQSGHFDFKAGLPFFMVTFSGLSTSFFALHLTQYMLAICNHLLSKEFIIHSIEFRINKVVRKAHLNAFDFEFDNYFHNCYC